MVEAQTAAQADEAVAPDQWLVGVLFVCFAIWFGAVTKLVVPLPSLIAAFLPLALVLACAVVSERLDARRFADLILPFAPLLVLALLSVFWGSDAAGIISKSVSLLALVACAAAFVVVSERPLETIARALVAYGVFHSALSLALIYSGGGMLAGAVVGITDNKSMLTNVSALVLIAGWHLLLTQPRDTVLTIFAVLAILLGGWILAIGGGGQALLALAAALVVLHIARRLPEAAAWLVVVIAVLAAALPFWPQGMVWLSELSGKDPTLSGRLYLWEFGRSGIAEAPLFGHGFSNVGTSQAWQVWQLDVFQHRFGISGFVVPNMHNQWIELAYMLGLPGLVLGLWVLVWRPTRYATIGSAFALSLLAMAATISAFGTSILITTGESFVTMVAIVALLQNRETQP